MAKARPPSTEFAVLFRPRTPAQQSAVDLWPRSRILFLLGPAGTGKSHVALGLALTTLLAGDRDRPRGRLLLTRPMVGCDEDPGLLPGDVDAKIGPWLLPFRDVLGEMSFNSWDQLQAAVDIEQVPVGMLRGRTVSNGVLVADECQQLTPAQVKCLLTRIGRGGRLVICGDPDQSDRYPDAASVPIADAARRLEGLDAVSVVRFGRADVVRDPLVASILDRLP